MLMDALQLRLAEGLMRKSATTCSRWSQQYIILGKPIAGPLGFRYHPWSREWMDCKQDWVGMKAAQMAMTMSALARSLFTIDILRNDVLYVLPKRSPDATDFSKSKFDTLLELSPHINSMFSNVKNVGHKQSGNVNFFLRGSRSKSSLKTISVGLKVFDEFDEMFQKNVTLAEERSSGYKEEDTQTIKLSTPTVPEFGIDREMLETTQEHFFFKCPKCGQHVEFIFPDDLIITTDTLTDEVGLRKSYYQCNRCKRPIDHEAKIDFLAKATWESTANRQSSIRGFYINQFYSTVIPPWKCAKLALKARIEPADEQEWYNSKGGLPHAVQGAKVSAEQFNACRHTHSKDGHPLPGLLTMGVDVGHKVLYYWIDRWLLPDPIGSDLSTFAVAQSLRMGTVFEFRDLDQWMRNFQIEHCMVDVDPAFRDAEEFAERWPGKVHLCRFIKGLRKTKIKTKTDESDNVVHANRTYWLDISQSRFLKGRSRILLPKDTPDEVSKHVQALTRHETKDKDGNLVASYKNTGPDHYAFARVYSEIALPLAVSISSSQDIKNLL